MAQTAVTLDHVNGATAAVVVVETDNKKKSKDGGYILEAPQAPPFSFVQGKPTIAELVIATPSLSILLAAVVRANLAGVLNSPYTFTVFAPNNDAFAKVPSDIANTLFTNDAFLPHLTDLLLYHVLGEVITTNQHAFFNNEKLSPLNGEKLLVTRPNLEVNGNLLIARNIEASNGVANIIDGVLIPSWVTNSITDLVVAISQLSTLLSLVSLAGLADALAGPGELTVVAPTNAAFACGYCQLFGFRCWYSYLGRHSPLPRL